LSKTLTTLRYVKTTVQSNWTICTRICSIKIKQEEHKKELLQSRGTVKAWKENGCNIRETEGDKWRLWKSLT